MLTFFLTPRIVNYANSKAYELGSLRGSITEGRGNWAGFVGEMLVADYLGATLENTYDYDLIIDGIRVDVKAKNTTATPRLDYECSVADFNTKQKCDMYAFVRVDKEANTAWILGWLPKDDFYKKARFLKKGQIDGSNRFEVKADCYNVYVRDLLPLEETLKGS